MRSDSPAMYQYFVNAIPTTYTDGKGNVTNTYQLDREIELRNRVTETHYLRPLERTSSLMPGVYFVYEFSPLRSIIKETQFSEVCLRSWEWWTESFFRLRRGRRVEVGQQSQN